MEEVEVTTSKNRSPTNIRALLLLMTGLGLMLVAVAISLAALPADEEPAIPITRVEYPAPDVQLTDLDGKPVALSDYRGQVVLYNAWATWCLPCKEEMPVLQSYYNDHKGQGLVVIAIEDGQPIDEILLYIQREKLTFPVWPDLEWKASIAFNVDVLPTSFVIDRQGIVRLTWSGAITRAGLEKHVTPLITTP